MVNARRVRARSFSESVIPVFAAAGGARIYTCAAEGVFGFVLNNSVTLVELIIINALITQ